MKRIVYFVMIALGLSVLMGTGTSCNKDVFDQSVYDTLVKRQSPVDSIDATHTWSLTKSTRLTVEANANVGTQQVVILDDNPLSSTNARVLARADVAEGGRASVNVIYPSRLSTLYAACIDSNGRYTVSAFDASASQVDFSAPIATQQKPGYTPELQYHAFCFEEEFPEPGDYDFNDVVLHIAVEPVSSRIVYFHVKLAAVGGKLQLAGCIRLPDFKYEDIDSVWTLNGESFNKDISDQYMVVLKERDPLLRGQNGEAILNLFADAHWATGDMLNADYGIFKRKQYNVTKASGTDAQLMVPREITFAVRMAEAGRTSGITLGNIDPFIIKQYSGANMEVHTYNYRDVKALNDYRYVALGHLPWALQVPNSSFAHPLEGINMGFRMKTESGQSILFGAYATTGHAFGEWAADKNSSLDWYLYPDKYNIFIW